MTATTRQLTPVEVCWHAAQQPAPNWQGKARKTITPPDPRPGVCALTGHSGAVWDARHVVSGLWTSYDRLRHRYADPEGLAFGPAAAWAIRHRAAMQRPHGVTSAGFQELDPPSALHRALMDHDGRSSVVCVPQSRQKQLLPWCELGTVRTDNESLTWTDDDKAMLGTYGALRLLGFGETALSEREPRWPILSKLGRDDQAWVLIHWHHLDRWRSHPDYLDVAARATRKDPT